MGLGLRPRSCCARYKILIRRPFRTDWFYHESRIIILSIEKFVASDTPNGDKGSGACPSPGLDARDLCWTRSWKPAVKHGRSTVMPTASGSRSARVNVWAAAFARSDTWADGRDCTTSPSPPRVRCARSVAICRRSSDRSQRSLSVRNRSTNRRVVSVRSTDRASSTYRNRLQSLARSITFEGPSPKTYTQSKREEVQAKKHV